MTEPEINKVSQQKLIDQTELLRKCDEDIVVYRKLTQIYKDAVRGGSEEDDNEWTAKVDAEARLEGAERYRNLIANAEVVVPTTRQCPQCDGKGWYAIQTGSSFPWEAEQKQCESCGATGLEQPTPPTP